MPANDSMPHRGVSAVRVGRRFTPYQPGDIHALKPHASCPNFSIQDPPILYVSSPEDSALDSAPETEISSTATLVNPSFETDKWDCSATPLLAESTLKLSEQHLKPARLSSLPQKVDYISTLIDFACKTLNEMWSLEDIPEIFRYQHGATFGYTKGTTGASLDEFVPRESATDLMSLRKFVQELLRRSRSTCATLQHALCYIEAVRGRVSSAQKAEKEGHGSRGDDVNNEGRIQIEPQYSLCSVEPSQSDQILGSSKSQKAGSSGVPLPQLPSPMLCPRRVFMAALILSAKFVQDKCYSNRAWAKLCGLPPREVSRCERALGDALGWRLWVGKGNLMPVAGLESKIGVPSPMFSSCPAIEDRKDFAVEKCISKPLGRAHTWPSLDVPEGLMPSTSLIETEFFTSPTPSLISSGSSICSSGTLSPFYPSPSPMFVPNDPYSANSSKHDATQARVAAFLNDVAFNIPDIKSCGGHSYLHQEQDVFGIRVAEIRVV